MLFELARQLLICHFFYVLAFDETIFAYGQISKDVMEQGRAQYQLLRERGSLPKYGSCWKAAVEHVDEGCRQLSEETQSDVALHLTNCFLETSGHETYKCGSDKKPNLRAICISSMSDRAFNVYTEFFTHTQNMCWFLRGQIWQETLTESTMRVGKQLEKSAEEQKKLLEMSMENIEIQERILSNGKKLETVLYDLSISAASYQEVLKTLTRVIAGLQSWLIGEVSWIDTIVFYAFAALLAVFATSVPRTVNARLPILILLFVNVICERFVCIWVLSNVFLADTALLHQNIFKYVWGLRYCFIFICVSIWLVQAYLYEDISKRNSNLLVNIQEQNKTILSFLQKLLNRDDSRGQSFKSDNFCFEKIESEVLNTSNGDLSKCLMNSFKHSPSPINLNGGYESRIASREQIHSISMKKNSFKKAYNGVQNRQPTPDRYNLRSRQNTPDLNVC